MQFLDLIQEGNIGLTVPLISLSIGAVLNFQLMQLGG